MQTLIQNADVGGAQIGVVALSADRATIWNGDVLAFVRGHVARICRAQVSIVALRI